MSHETPWIWTWIVELPMGKALRKTGNFSKDRQLLHIPYLNNIDNYVKGKHKELYNMTYLRRSFLNEDDVTLSRQLQLLLLLILVALNKNKEHRLSKSFTHSRERRWIHAFPKGVSTQGNVNSHVQVWVRLDESFSNDNTITIHNYRPIYIYIYILTLIIKLWRDLSRILMAKKHWDLGFDWQKVLGIEIWWRRRILSSNSLHHGTALWWLTEHWST